MGLYSRSASSLVSWLGERSGLAVAVLLSITLLALAGAFRIDYSDNPRDLFARDDDASRRLDELRASFGADDTQLVIMLQGERLLERDALNRLQRLVEKLRADDELVDVHSLLDARRAVKFGRRAMYLMIVPAEDRVDADYDEVRQLLLEHPLLASRMLSTDGETTVVLAQMDDQILEVSQAARVVERIEGMARSAFAGSTVSVRISGQPVLRIESLGNLKADQARIQWLSGATLLTVALLLFRRLQPVILALAGPAVGAAWMLGVMGWTEQRMDGINVVLPTLLLVIGFTDSLHLVMAIREFRRSGESPTTAAKLAIGRVGTACLLTSITTAVSFGSLTLSSLVTIQRFGLYAAAGILLLFLAVMTVVPLLSLLPWLREVSPERATPTDSVTRFLNSIYRFIARNPLPVAAASLGCGILLVIGSRHMQIDMFWSEALPRTSETVQATERLDQVFGGSIFAQVVVGWPKELRADSSEVLTAVSQLQKTLEESFASAVDLPVRVGKPVSIINVLEGMQPAGSRLSTGFSQLRRRTPERLRRLVREDEHRQLIHIPVPDAGAQKLLPLFERMDQRLSVWETQHAGYTAYLTGSTVVSARNLSEIVHELFRSVMVAAAVVFVVLCIAFRSFILGLLSVIPNSLPLLAVMGWLTATDRPLQITSVMTLCISLGIAVDDTIHLVEAFRRELASSPKRVALAWRRAYLAVGKVIVLTTIVLIAGFGVMLTSRSLTIQLFGEANCVALTAALIGDLLFLPALLLIGSHVLSAASRR